MKRKSILSTLLALALSLSLCVPAFAYGDTGKSGAYNVISSSDTHSGAVDKNGGLWMWGTNSRGALGNNTNEDASTPVKVMDGVAAVSCGTNFTAAIKTDGSLWTWGLNSAGQLGNGTETSSSVPAKIMDGVAAVSCGTAHTAAIKTDGSLWTWGVNGSGQLGDGTQEEAMTPIKLMDGVAAVSCGDTFAAAVKTDGSLWMWGSNSSGQLGNGTTTSSPIPVKVMDGVAAVSCGSSHAVAVKTDGSVWTWGLNSWGELGNGGTGNQTNNSGEPIQTVPVKVLDGAAAVSCGTRFTAVLKTDGSLWMWGLSDIGQLGNGGAGNAIDNSKTKPRTYQNVPIEVLNGVAAVNCGDSRTIAVKTDGSLWAWGSNTSNRLGNGGAGNSTSPASGSVIQTVPVQLSLAGASIAIPAAPTTPSTPTTPESSAKPAVSLTKQNLTVNGAAKNTEIYNIDGSNYFKLRDMAALLNGTTSQFSVDFNSATSTIVVKTGAAYTLAGGELATGTDKSSTATASKQSIEIDGKKADLTAYNIGGNNFFKLRDLGTALNFDVDYDSATSTMIVKSK